MYCSTVASKLCNLCTIFHNPPYLSKSSIALKVMYQITSYSPLTYVYIGGEHQCVIIYVDLLANNAWIGLIFSSDTPEEGQGPSYVVRK